MYDDEELLPISALQHLAFCPRQCALLHVEGLWAENRLTVQGKQLHDQAHEPGTESRCDLRIARGLRLRSLRLGLAGQCDVVEFHRVPDNCSDQGVHLEGLSGLWQPFPVEYKRGKPKSDDCDLVQLCAQALCLEEMLGVILQRGAMYYGQPRRRLEVDFDEALRSRVEQLAMQLRQMLTDGITPEPVKSPRCRGCSMSDQCLPATTGRSHRASRYVQSILDTALKEEDPPI
ncbi:CRISPR-associated protein Cas4 [bacterium]|nr:CRISPR-associated protein Cas4 [bacterium]